MTMMTKTRKDETGLDALDPRKDHARDAVHFRNIIAARKKVADAEQDLSDVVQAARDAGDSSKVLVQPAPAVWGRPWSSSRSTSAPRRRRPRAERTRSWCAGSAPTSS
jgi:hypothetical protein